MRIIGDFKIKHEIGRGGMGVVYLARQLSLARDVALKVLSEEATAEADRILRFQREASLLGRCPTRISSRCSWSARRRAATAW